MGKTLLLKILPVQRWVPLLPYVPPIRTSYRSKLLPQKPKRASAAVGLPPDFERSLALPVQLRTCIRSATTARMLPTTAVTGATGGSSSTNHFHLNARSRALTLVMEQPHKGHLPAPLVWAPSTPTAARTRFQLPPYPKTTEPRYPAVERSTANRSTHAKERAESTNHNKLSCISRCQPHRLFGLGDRDITNALPAHAYTSMVPPVKGHDVTGSRSHAPTTRSMSPTRHPLGTHICAQQQNEHLHVAGTSRYIIPLPNPSLSTYHAPHCSHCTS